MDQKATETAEQQSQPGAVQGQLQEEAGQAELSQAENQIPLKQLCAKESEREKERDEVQQAVQLWCPA